MKWSWQSTKDSAWLTVVLWTKPKVCNRSVYTNKLLRKVVLISYESESGHDWWTEVLCIRQCTKQSPWLHAQIFVWCHVCTRSWQTNSLLRNTMLFCNVQWQEIKSTNCLCHGSQSLPHQSNLACHSFCMIMPRIVSLLGKTSYSHLHF